MAHLKAQETRQDSVARQTWKLWLTRRLYKLGKDRQRVIELFRFIDWVLQLPESQDQAFLQEVHEMEEEKRMQYVTSVERIGIQQGIQQGEAAMVLRVLNRRFGAVSSDLTLRIRSLLDPQLFSLMDVALAAATLSEVAAAVEALSTGAFDDSLPSV